MKLKKAFHLALNILLHSKLRSWLTVIGIVIGVAAVVSIISISEGAKQSLEDRLGGLGADIITISPGFSRAAGFGGDFRDHMDREKSTSSTTSQKNLTSRDIMVLKGISNVKSVMGEVSGRSELTYSTKTASASLTGVDTAVWKDITTDKLASGRLLTTGDSFSIVLGGNIANSVFNPPITLNSKVIIDGKSFKVVGILEEGSTSYIPIDIARDILENAGNDKFDSIIVKVKDVSISDATVDEITKKLMLSRGILQAKNQDFSVRSQKAMQETMQETMDTMSLFLGAIAVISLIVGAIGIANTMFTSVLEKTKDIGIMKAIGTKNKDILLIFLINSGLIGLVGGIGGILLGIAGSGLIGYLGSSAAGAGKFFGNTAITPKLLILSLLISVLIGMIAGIIPAYRASKLKPVDALRSE